MNIELVEILLAIRANAISINNCIHVEHQLFKESCYPLNCYNCPLFQSNEKPHYFDNWASVPSHLTIEVKNE